MSYLTLAFALGFFVFAVSWGLQRKARISAEKERDLAKSSQSELEAKFSRVIDVENERQKILAEKSKLEQQLSELSAQYKEKKGIFNLLVKEMAVFDERLSFAEMGIYEPHFEFTDSEQYKSAISEVREKQKITVSAGKAAICHIPWTVDGSRAKGEQMTKRAIKLTLRAFNGECDAAISNIRWNNANAMEQRIAKAKEQIEKLNASNKISIEDYYFRLKLQELQLTHEYREKLKQEKEERAELARAAREEQKLQRDLERAQEEEARYQQLLAKAQADASKSSGPQLEAYSERIKLLEKDLSEAHARAERAQAMAERTRSGYVYVISNVGSFGGDVVKIGLTRRLDPSDRIQELGDASVPFTFDTHAIIYSDNAPALERALHAEFESTRVNTQNYRKEFFKASIDAVESAVKRLAPDAPFFKDVEAQDYRETLARRASLLAIPKAAAAIAALPDAI